MNIWNWIRLIVAGLLAIFALRCCSGAGNSAVNGALPAAGALAFNYPTNNEVLDAQQYILNGTGKPGAILDVMRDGVKIGETTVGADGKWSYAVQDAGTKPGTYKYEIRGSGEATGQTLTVVVKEGQTDASNAKCPCKLRIFTLEKQNIQGATVTLLKDGNTFKEGTSPQLFEDLDAGDYTYTVSAPGYASFETGKATLPRNKAFSVYLKPSK